jgi:hypothetical protein
MRPGNLVFLLPMKEDGIEEDDEASVFHLTGAEKSTTRQLVFLLPVKKDGIEEDDEASGFKLTGAEKYATRQRGFSLTREGGWNRRRRPGEGFFNLLEPKNMRPGN